MRSAPLRLVVGMGLALALVACAGRLPAGPPSDRPAASDNSQASASAPASPTVHATAAPQATPMPPTFSFDPGSIASELAGVDTQLRDIDSSLNASDSAPGGEGTQP